MITDNANDPTIFTTGYTATFYKETVGVVPTLQNGAAVANIYSKNYFDGRAPVNQNTIAGGGVAIRSWLGFNSVAEASYLPFSSNEQIGNADSTPATGASGHSQFGNLFAVVNYDHRYTNNDIAAGLTDWNLHTSFSGQTRWAGCSLLVNHYWPTMAINSTLNGVTGWLYNSNPGIGGGMDDNKQVNCTITTTSTSSTAFTVSNITSGTQSAIVPGMLVTSTLVPTGTFVATFSGTSGTLSQNPTSTGSDSSCIIGLISYASQCAFGAVGWAGPIALANNAVGSNSFEFTKYAFQAGSDGGTTQGIWVGYNHRSKYYEAFHAEDFSSLGLHLVNANTTTNPLNVSAVMIVSQGNGQYVNGDVVALVSPLSGARAALISLTVSGGSITAGTVIDPGIYNAAPSGNVPVANVAGATSGLGNGATFTVTTEAANQGAAFIESSAGGVGIWTPPDNAGEADPIPLRVDPIGNTSNRALQVQANTAGASVISPRVTNFRSLRESSGGLIGSYEFNSDDSTSAFQIYSRLVGTVISDTAGVFDGGLQIRTALAGAEVNALVISGQTLQLPGYVNGLLSVDSSGNVGISGYPANATAAIGEVNTKQSHTGDALETVLAYVTIPANTIGAKGTLMISMLGSCTGSGNSKTFNIRFGVLNDTSGIAYLSQSTTNASNISFAPAPWFIANRNATNSQVGDNNIAAGFGSGGIITSSIDTTATTYVVVTGKLTTTTETISCERLCVTLIPGV